MADDKKFSPAAFADTSSPPQTGGLSSSAWSPSAFGQQAAPEAPSSAPTVTPPKDQTDTSTWSPSAFKQDESAKGASSGFSPSSFDLDQVHKLDEQKRVPQFGSDAADPNAPWYKKAWDWVNSPTVDFEHIATDWFGRDPKDIGGFEHGFYDLLSGLTSPLQLGLTIGTLGSSSLFEAGGMAALKGVMAAEDLNMVAKGSSVMAKFLKAGKTADEAYQAMPAMNIVPEVVRGGLETLAKKGLTPESLIGEGLVRRAGGTMLRAGGMTAGEADKISKWVQFAVDGGFTVQNAYGAAIASPRVFDAIKEGDYETAKRLAVDAIGSGAFAYLGGRAIFKHHGELMPDAAAKMGLRVKPSEENARLMKLFEPMDRDRIVAFEHEKQWEQTMRKKYKDLSAENMQLARFRYEAGSESELGKWHNFIAKSAGKDDAIIPGVPEQEGDSDESYINLKSVADKELLKEKSPEYINRLLAQTDPRNLTPRLTEFSKDIAEHFNETLEKAVANGSLREGLDNYVTRIWKDPENPTIKKFRALSQEGQFNLNTKMARKRTFDATVEGLLSGRELADHDPIALAANNGNEFARINTNREALAAIADHNVRTTEGRPMVALSGGGHIIEGDDQTSPAYAIQPRRMQSVRMAEKVVEGLRENIIGPAAEPVQAERVSAERMLASQFTKEAPYGIPQLTWDRLSEYSKGQWLKWAREHNIQPKDVRPEDIGIVTDPYAWEGFPIGRPASEGEQLRENITTAGGGPPQFRQFVQKAVTGAGKLKLGADLEELAKSLGSSLYGGKPHEVIPKELIQNARDAVRLSKGEKTVYVDIGKDGVITVRDTGLGMTRKELETVFTDLGASGKREQESASGGFGLAKAAPFMMGKSLHVETVVDEGGKRLKHWFTSTPDEIVRGGADLHTKEVSKDEPTGTTVRSTINPKDSSGYDVMYQAQKVAEDAKRSIRAPGDLVISKDGKRVETEHAPIETKPLASGSSDGADIDIYKSNEPGTGMMGTIPVEVNNNGIYQFTVYVYTQGAGVRWVPKRLVADIKSTVKEGHTDYPFLANRESLRGDTERQVKKIIQDKIINPLAGEQRDLISKIYNSLPKVTGTYVPIFDSGGRFTPAELKEIQDHPVVKDIGNTIRALTYKAIQRARDAAKAAMDKATEKVGGERGRLSLREEHRVPMNQLEEAGNNIQRIGLVFSDDVHGVYIEDPMGGQRVKSGASEVTTPKHATVFINPFSVGDVDPWQAASLMWHTIKHEIAHDAVKGHYEDFTTYEKDFSHSQGENELKSIQALRELYADKDDPTRIRKDLDRPLQIYRESRARPESTPDILGGEAVRQRGESAGAGEGRGTRSVQRGGEGPVRTEPTTELEKLLKEGKVVKYGTDKRTGRDLYAWATHDYKTIDNPSFRGWKVPLTDEEGHPIYLEGEMRAHPEAAEYLNRRFGTKESIVKRVPGMKAVLAAGREAKGFLLFASPFHVVQEGLRAIMTGISPIGVEKFNADNNTHLLAASKGVWEGRDHSGVTMFEEGLAGHSKIIAKVPGLAQLQHGLQTFLFDRYIPGLKLRGFERMLKRYTDAYSDGKGNWKEGWSEDRAANVAADEVNERFGGLPYKRMGRAAGAMDAARLLTLAPDWLESEVRFMARMFGEEGKFARRDMAKMALYLWGASRVLNYLISGQPHNEAPFGVAWKDEDGREKVISLRTMPTDMLHAMSDPAGFVRGRVSPVVRVGTEAYTGRDEFGRKLASNNIWLNMMRNVAPISMQPLGRRLSGEQDVSYRESAAKAAGLTVFPYRTEGQKLAAELASDRSEAGPVDRDKLRRHQTIIEMENRVRLGQIPVGDVFKAVEQGQLHLDEAKAIMKNIQATAGMDTDTARLYAHVSRLPMSDVLQVWDKSTNKEKAALAQLFLKKKQAYMKKAIKDMSSAERDADPTYQRLRSMFPQDPPWGGTGGAAFGGTQSAFPQAAPANFEEKQPKQSRSQREQPGGKLGLTIKGNLPSPPVVKGIKVDTFDKALEVFKGRPLSNEEVKAVAPIFQNLLDIGEIRVHDIPEDVLERVAEVPGGGKGILGLSQEDKLKDVGVAVLPAGQQFERFGTTRSGIVAHEITHLYQQRGGKYRTGEPIVGGERGQFKQYDYGTLEDLVKGRKKGMKFSDFTEEQQGRVIEDYIYYSGRLSKATTPFAKQRYTEELAALQPYVDDLMNSRSYKAADIPADVLEDAVNFVKDVIQGAKKGDFSKLGIF